MFARTCGFEGCTNKHRARGLCSSHLDQLARGRELTPLLGPHGRRYEHCTFIKCPDPDHPNAKSKPGWIAEHVWVMSQVLGRPLRRGESVHHKNNIKHDNRPENLELWHTHQPRGASVEDTVRWARWFLAEHGAEFPETTSEI
jgi:HNH endonuclease